MTLPDPLTAANQRAAALDAERDAARALARETAANLANVVMRCGELERQIEVMREMHKQERENLGFQVAIAREARDAAWNGGIEAAARLVESYFVCLAAHVRKLARPSTPVVASTYPPSTQEQLCDDTSIPTSGDPGRS